jgi:phage tail tube protein FII
MSQFYIMRARHLASTPRKLSVAAVARAQGECTLILATRRYGWDKTVPCTITGSRSDYDVKPGDKSSYTIDTGLGYRNRNSDLDIEQVFQINTEGLVDRVNGVDLIKPQPITNFVTDKRHTWVMK